MSVQHYLDLARSIISSSGPLPHDCLEQIAYLPEERVFDLLPGATLLREHYFANRIHLCVINNAKSGKCSEDCTFCAQSGRYDTGVDTYPLKSLKTLQQEMATLEGTPVNRYAVVTSGKGAAPDEIEQICAAFGSVSSHNGPAFCASLGILDRPALGKLAAAGVTRYHHNLETARSHFDQICSTHTYDQRIKTILAAKKAGLGVCSGGIFGLGETELQALELALELKGLAVDAVPLNFLSPIEGTPLSGLRGLTPMQCLKRIALFRFCLPDRQIIICGGRQANLGTLHPYIFHAGASGIMTGNYLTTGGRLLEQDLSLLCDLGLVPDKEMRPS